MKSSTDISFQSKVSLGDFDSSIGLDRGANKLKEIIWYVTKVLFFLSAIPFPSKFKIWLLKLYGAEMGDNITLKPRVNIHFPWKLVVGNNVWIGEESSLLNFEELIIGNNVCISQRAFLCGGNHDYKLPSMPYRNGSILLQDGCWIGACVFVGPNVSIGKDTVITAGSIITSDVDANLIYRKGNTDFQKKGWEINTTV